MGDYNPNANNPLGLETRLLTRRDVVLDSPLVAVAQRVKTGAITLARDHVLIRQVQGTPAFAVDYVTELAPATTTTIYTNKTETTGEVSTGWQDQAGGTVEVADVSDPYNDASYVRNTSAQSRTGQLPIKFRGNDAGALTGRRVLRVRIGATVQLRRVTDNAQTVLIAGGFTINAVDYYAPARSVAKTQANSFQRIDDLATFYFNPETGLPWTAAEIDDVLDTADADTYNFYVQGKLAAAGFRLSAYWVEVVHCAENRVGYHHQTQAPRLGWQEMPGSGTLAGTSLLSANTYYWRVVSAPRATSKDLFTVAVERGLWTPAVLATETTTEHRQASVLALVAPGGVAGANPGDVSTKTDEMVGGYLTESTAPAILSQSQPYADVPTRTLNSASPANIGQQLTGGAGLTYAGVVLAIGWENLAVRPTGPLIVEVRSGVGAISGGGSLHATAVIDPDALPTGAIQEHQAGLLASFASAAVQYHVILRSSAAPGSGWATVKNDVRTDLTMTGTTIAEVEGATFGGQTDSYIEAGSAFDRYDVPVALLAAPSPPRNLTATVLPSFADDFLRDPDIAGTAPESLPVRVALGWTAPVVLLGASFGKYRVTRQALRVPVDVPTVIAELGPRAGIADAATTEAQERFYTDKQATPTVAGAGYVDGWRYTVTAVSARGLESPPAVIDLVNSSDGTPAIPAPTDTWVVFNDAWWLDNPIRVEADPTVDSDGARHEDGPFASDDLSRVRVAGTVPPTRLDLDWEYGKYPTREQLRLPRNAAISGREAALIRCTGDREFGALGWPRARGRGATVESGAEFNVTGTDSPTTGPNEPLGIVLDGVADTATMADDPALDPAGDAFTFAIAAKFPNAVGAYASKGNLGTAVGYGLLAGGGGTFSWFIDGAGVPNVALVGNVPPAYAVIIGDSTGTAQTLWIDEDEVAASAVAHGAVANAVALAIGSNNGGANLFSALDPFRAVAVWRRILTDDEKTRLVRYWHGHAGYRPPPRAERFVDLRDSRCFTGVGTTATDLTGSGALLNLVSAPAVRGATADLVDTDRWR